MEEMDKALADIRKEIIEARNLVIRNDNLLKSLGSDLKAIGKKQDVFERRRWISAASAYLIFAVLAAAGSLLISRGYISLARAEIAGLQEKAEEATEQATLAKEGLAAAREASAAALAAYQKLDAGSAAEREAAAWDLQQIDRNRISALEARALDDRGRQVVQDLANQYLESGRTAFRRNDWKTSVQDLQKAVTLWPDHPQAADTSYFLGAAAVEVRDYDLAVDSLRRFIAEAKGRANKDYAHLLLANAYAARGGTDQAREVLLQGISNYPASQFLQPMRRRLASLRKQPQETAQEQ